MWTTKKIAREAVQAMSAADLPRFLVVCALVSDLYCPGYNSKQPLGKDSNLARAAVRYKVDTANVAAAVRAELTREKKRPMFADDKEAAGSTSIHRKPSNAKSNKKS